MYDDHNYTMQVVSMAANHANCICRSAITTNVARPPASTTPMRRVSVSTNEGGTGRLLMLFFIYFYLLIYFFLDFDVCLFRTRAWCTPFALS